jgi:hypothetical protein
MEAPSFHTAWTQNGHFFALHIFHHRDESEAGAKRGIGVRFHCASLHDAGWSVLAGAYTHDVHAHPASDRVGLYGMDSSATKNVPRGYKAQCRPK